MNDILLSIPVILVVGLIILGIFIITGRKKRQREEAFKQLAISSGWHYEAINQVQKKGFILGGEGWRLESIAESTDQSGEAGSSAWSYMNKWHTDRVNLPAGLVMIGPKTPNVQLGQMGGLGNLVVQQALRLMLGADAQQAAQLAEVFVGRTSFRDRYSVWATSEAAAEKVLTFELENALLNWQYNEFPVLKVNQHGVEITTRQSRLEKPEDVRTLVEVGKAVLGG